MECNDPLSCHVRFGCAVHYERVRPDSDFIGAVSGDGRQRTPGGPVRLTVGSIENKLNTSQRLVAFAASVHGNRLLAKHPIDDGHLSPDPKHVVHSDRWPIRTANSNDQVPGAESEEPVADSVASPFLHR